MEKNKRENLKKKDISKNIYLKSGIPISYASKFLDDTINILISELKNNGTLKINKFGSFKVRFKKSVSLSLIFLLKRLINSLLNSKLTFLSVIFFVKLINVRYLLNFETI